MQCSDQANPHVYVKVMFARELRHPIGKGQAVLSTNDSWEIGYPHAKWEKGGKERNSVYLFFI